MAGSQGHRILLGGDCGSSSATRAAGGVTRVLAGGVHRDLGARELGIASVPRLRLVDIHAALSGLMRVTVSGHSEGPLGVGSGHRPGVQKRTSAGRAGIEWGAITAIGSKVSRETANVV
jgi:hypothetical protein